MLEDIENYVNLLSDNKKVWIEELSKVIKNRFPHATESFKNNMPTYSYQENYVAFSPQKSYFSFYSNEEHTLSTLKALMPKAKFSKNSVNLKYNDPFAFHAIKVALSCVLNPNKVNYPNIHKAKFINRPNRFIANIEISGEIHECHVKNTGRCKELLIPDATIYVQKHNSPKRKTNYSLISVIKGNKLINIDSQVPNKAVHKWLMQGNLFNNITYIKPEYTYNNSRIDFYIEADGKKILLEVKGATLENNGVVLFPDAPTKRGVKHIKELEHAKSEGFETYILFVIQMENVKYFTPNAQTHPEFKQTLKSAIENGVHALAYDCIVHPNCIAINNECKIIM